MGTSINGPVAPRGYTDLEAQVFGKGWVDFVRGTARAMRNDPFFNRDQLDDQERQENEFLRQLMSGKPPSFVPGGISSSGMNQSQAPVMLQASTPTMEQTLQAALAGKKNPQDAWNTNTLLPTLVNPPGMRTNDSGRFF